MPSPFPGMNPYVEHPSVWRDFHESFMPAVRQMINAQVLPHYFVKIGEHIFGVELEAPSQVYQVEVDEERVSYLEIRDRQNQQLVTVIELLSPANKAPGRDRDQYENKRLQYLHSNVHFVEIDLLRGGRRMPWLDMPSCDYCIAVSHLQNRPRAGFWPIMLRDPLPTIPIPLKEGDADAKLDLQAVLHRIYDEAGYQYYIYNNEPEPPLSAEDAAWARKVLSQE